MSIFCIKPIETPETLGTKFREARQKAGGNVGVWAEKTRVPAKYIQALEQSSYSVLPSTKAHRLAYVRTYAEALGLDVEQCVSEFKKEHGLDDVKNIHPHRSLSMTPLSSLSALVRYLGLAIIVILFSGYLIWQVKGIVTPPKLEVYSPLEGMITGAPNAIVQGETEKECHLTINGQEVMTDDNGRFLTEIDLLPGVNTITIVAVKKHGKTTTVTRHIVAK